MAKTGDAGGGAAKSFDEFVKEATDGVLISKKALGTLLDDADAYKEKIDGLVGELREEIGNAVEKKHLSKDAFADVKRYRRIKSNEKAAARFRDFIAYMVMSGQLARIMAVPGLPLDGKTAENVVSIGDGKDKERPGSALQ